MKNEYDYDETVIKIIRNDFEIKRIQHCFLKLLGSELSNKGFNFKCHSIVKNQ